MNTKQFRLSIIDFINSRATGNIGEYRMCDGGQVTLYSSCFSVMTLHYLNAFEAYSTEEREKWVSYINSWQDMDTGYYVGPEIRGQKITSTGHNLEHVSMHLTAHVLPTLLILGGRPSFPLHFAHRFLNPVYLQEWLDARDWTKAWLEGNNLLFVGQFLIYLSEHEERLEAKHALDLYFNWLDEQQDSVTGLWGTNGYCGNHAAMCGGYHQLLTYYYCRREVRHNERIIDTTLALQHVDGGFGPKGNSGACEDVDAVDILVNMYKLTEGNYRGLEIRRALKKALRNIKRKQLSNGGFVYRYNVPFIHNSLPRTACPVNVPHMFATWFRVHTIALICEILNDEPLAKVNWNFNPCCSMGWHRKWETTHHRLTTGEKIYLSFFDISDQTNYAFYVIRKKMNKRISHIKGRIMHLFHNKMKL